MMKNKFLSFVMVVLLAGPVAFAADIKVADPASQGFSAQGLDALRAHFQAYVDEGRLKGLTTLVARHGKVVQFEAYGSAKPAEGVAMDDDAIFRIYSMTKPVTGVALMMLYEEGRFDLDDPVSKYIPAFANARVFKGKAEDGTIETVPAKREITIRDLMRHTAGLTYGVFGNTPVDQIYRESGLLEPGQALGPWVDKLASLPLLYQPGEAWVYSFAVDVQGRLVELLSGQSLDEFFQSRIFDPLGMTDTGFYLTSEQVSRVVDMYEMKKDEGLVPSGDVYFSNFTEKPSLLSGGGGLLSTTADYFRFAQMVANGGTLDGVRLLKPETVAMMATDQLPEGVDGIARGTMGLGFGLDFAVVNDPAKQRGANKGEFNWGGMANTVFWIDPETDVVAILMTNILPSGLYTLREEMREQVYGALEARQDTAR